MYTITSIILIILFSVIFCTVCHQRRFKIVFFFFSSRRRHTRCLSDWSSDVCSSDLKALGGTGHTLVAGWAARLGERMGRRRASDGAVTLQMPISDRTAGDVRANAMSFVTISVDPTPVTRSEERRVGKEWKMRGAAAR